MRVIWSAPAEADLDHIVLHIAAENLGAALGQEDRIRDGVLMLEQHPHLGRPGRLPNSRELVVTGTPYLVVYYVGTLQVEIARVIHGARNWPPE